MSTWVWNGTVSSTSAISLKKTKMWIAWTKPSHHRLFRRPVDGIATGTGIGTGGRETAAEEIGIVAVEEIAVVSPPPLRLRRQNRQLKLPKPRNRWKQGQSRKGKFLPAWKRLWRERQLNRPKTAEDGAGAVDAEAALGDSRNQSMPA